MSIHSSFHLALVVRVIHVVVGLARSFHLALVVRVIHLVVGLARSFHLALLVSDSSGCRLG